MGSLASFKRRLDSLAFACIRLQVSSVAWVRLDSLASFKRRLLLLEFAWVRLQISSVAWIRLDSLASFKHRFFATIVAASKKQPWRLLHQQKNTLHTVNDKLPIE